MYNYGSHGESIYNLVVVVIFVTLQIAGGY